MNLKEEWQKMEQKSFIGWDFSFINDLMEEETLPWDYKAIIERYRQENDYLLDMGTGGGEFLLTLKHLHKLTSVTESYETNVKVCQDKLTPLGINVYPVLNDSSLPILDSQFDLIINRHESYDVKEIRRILKPNGLFITQQVGGKNNESLSNRLVKDFKPLYPHLNLFNAVTELKQNQFEILDQNEYFPYLRFFDIGALVYFAKIIEWEFPQFSVDKCYNELLHLQQELKEKSYIESFEHRYLIVARNKK